MKIGFVGVGNIGHHLAASLLRAGFEVTVLIWINQQSIG